MDDPLDIFDDTYDMSDAFVAAPSPQISQGQESCLALENEPLPLYVVQRHWRAGLI